MTEHEVTASAADDSTALAPDSGALVPADGTASPTGASAPLAPLTSAMRARMRSFYAVLINTALANVTSSYLWFALTFWVYLETKSLLASGIIGGAYMLLVAAFGMVFGAIVDHLRKKAAMILSSVTTLATYGVAAVMFALLPESTLLDWRGGWFWIFVIIILIGSVVENMRNIALSTTVTLLVPSDRRDRANGLVGTISGIGFLVTSVFSGLSVGLLGMGPTITIAVVATGLALVHLLLISIPEPHKVRSESGRVDFRGAIPVIMAVPGLLALLLFTTFNNLVGGVFMTLMDPYGLTLFPVEVWGIVLGVTSIGFIIGGGLVAKFGLGKNPLRTLLLVNVGVAVLGMTFTAREWAWLYVLGLLIFMTLMPAAEAAEQTILQRVIPYEKQGRVFGFAMTVEVSAAPITAFLIGPIAEFIIVPYMNSDAGRDTWGWLLGEGEARGMALVFVIASVIMLIAVLLAFASRPYRQLSKAYADAPPPDPSAGDDESSGDDGERSGGGDGEPSSQAGEQSGVPGEGVPGDSVREVL